MRSKKKLDPPINIYHHPERARVLWHDAKNFTSAASIYLESMLEGVYGPLPLKIQEPLANLRASAITQSITLENNAILNKIEISSLSVYPQNSSVSDQFRSAIRFLQAVLEKKGITLSSHIKKELKLPLDERYGLIFIQNMVFLAMTLLSKRGKIVHLKANERGIEITCPVSFDEKTLHQKLSKKNIYSQKATDSSFVALLYFVNFHLALAGSATFKASVEKRQLVLKYVC